MTINLNPINLYQEFDPYDIDVDNRPLLDIQDNLSKIAELLGHLGYYSDISADPSQEPAGGFLPFTCAAVYSNSLLIPIDISNSIYEIDYTTYPIVLILGAKNTDTNTYPCLFFSAGLGLSNKFAYFTTGSQGRLLLVGPGGQLVDQMYYDLAHSAKGYQSLYVGKILSPTSIVFGGNQVNILGNNYYLAKNRNDTTSGLVTVQRSNNDSNVVFKSVTVNTVGTSYPFAEFTNGYSSSTVITTYPVPVYFSSAELEFNQQSGSFSSSDLESNLNELHFSTPAVGTFTQADQKYLTAGLNVRSLLDFASSNIIHAPSYSNNVSELTQSLSTRLLFSDRTKTISTDPDIPLGVSMSTPATTVGNAILASTNQPANLLPTVDSTGVIFSDYFAATGAYIGGVIDDSSLTTSRMLAVDDINNQKANIVNGLDSGFTTNGINDYSDSFTLLISSKSDTTVAANIALRADGYINLSSGKGILTNAATPVLAAELTSKSYVDGRIKVVMDSELTKIPLTGTNNPDPTTGTATITPVTGSISFDVQGNNVSTSKVLAFKTIGTTDIASNNIIKFVEEDGTTPQILQAGATPYVAVGSNPLTPLNEVVTRTILDSFVTEKLVGGTGIYVTTTGTQSIAGDKAFEGITSFWNTSASAAPNFRLAAQDNLSLIPVDFSLLSSNSLSITNVQPVLLSRSTDAADPDGSITTKDYVDAAVASSVADIGPAYDSKSVVSSLKTVPVLTGLDRYGYHVIGEIVTFWAYTKEQASPYTDRTGGDASNPEYSLLLPPGLFSEIYTVQAQIINRALSGGAQDWFTQVFNVMPSSINIKYQTAYGAAALSPLQASILVIGRFGTWPPS